MPPPTIPASTPNHQASHQVQPLRPSHLAPNIIVPRPHTQAPSDPLEQRILDLLYPYRDECFAEENETTELKERNALILCGMSSPALDHLLNPGKSQ